MSRKIGGWVCDNDNCRKFSEYANFFDAMGVKEGEDIFCSKECAKKSEYKQDFQKLLDNDTKE